MGATVDIREIQRVAEERICPLLALGPAPPEDLFEGRQDALGRNAVAWLENEGRAIYCDGLWSLREGAAPKPSPRFSEGELREALDVQRYALFKLCSQGPLGALEESDVQSAANEALAILMDRWDPERAPLRAYLWISMPRLIISLVRAETHSRVGSRAKDVSALEPLAGEWSVIASDENAEMWMAEIDALERLREHVLRLPSTMRGILLDVLGGDTLTSACQRVDVSKSWGSRLLDRAEEMLRVRMLDDEMIPFEP